MKSKIYVNLPVKDLKRSMDFWRQIGFEFNMQFTDERAACLIINDGSIYAMLLTHEMFKTFTNRAIADTQKYTQVLIAVEVESRAKVDELVSMALENGGTSYSNPMDHGWMYQNSFADPDGHQWEILYSDEEKLASLQQ